MLKLRTNVAILARTGAYAAFFGIGWISAKVMRWFR